jgi:sec-independent protein translocase protein TatC
MAGSVDEDTRRTIADGRRTLGTMLSTVQRHLQKVFVVFVIVFIGTFYALRLFVWEQLKTDLFSRLGPALTQDNLVIATTPFDVILLQVKIGLVIGVLVSIPPLLYYSRDALRARGFWPRLPRWKIAVLSLMALALFVAGGTYSYELFFPLMFEFLVTNAIQTGIQPTYSIVLWAQFVFLLTLSFGLAAQLPLAMSGLAYAEVVPYETLREKWKYAVVAIFAFGALFSPPDPFTQILWALPLVTLYAFSLKLTKFVVAIKYGSQRVSVRRTLRERWTVPLAGALLGASVVAGGLFAASEGVLGRSLSVPGLGGTVGVPAAPLTPVVEAFGVSQAVALALLGIAGALLAASLALAYVLYTSIDLGAATRRGRQLDDSMGDPTAIDLGELDAAGVRATPEEAFLAMSEDEALADAGAAMEADDSEKAQAILDRFDEAAADAAEADPEPNSEDGEWSGDWESAAGESGEVGDSEPEPADPYGEMEADVDADSTGAGAGSEPSDSSAFSRTAAGMVDSFTEEETTEEDIGGYYYDIAFIASSLRSKAFRLVALFMTVLAGTFYFLYQGGIGRIKRDFFSRLPPEIVPPDAVIALHPVEVLVFDVKVSTLAAAIVTLPFLLYYAWPSLKERGFAGGDRRVLLLWAGTLVFGLVGGSLLGYVFVAPTIISWLATDAARASMVLAYRISSAGWLVFFTTAGVGLLATVPLSMVLFHRGGIASYRAMRSRWREVTIAVLAITAYATPQGVFMMFIIGIPAMLTYGLGLGLLWLATLRGRRRTGGRGQTAD